MVAIAYALGLSGLALAAVWLAVLIIPLQSVSAAGQTVRVGAAPLDWSLSGPGQLDLFGQTIPTRAHFDGPIRPRLELTRIRGDAEVARLLRSGDHERLTLEGALRTTTSLGNIEHDPFGFLAGQLAALEDPAAQLVADTAVGPSSVHAQSGASSRTTGGRGLFVRVSEPGAASSTWAHALYGCNADGQGSGGGGRTVYPLGGLVAVH